MKKCIKKNKIILGICVIFVLLLIGLLLLDLNHSRKMVIDVNKQNLQILADEKASQVDNFFEFKEEELKAIASMDVFKEVLMYPNDSSKIEKARESIDALKEITPGIGVLTKEGIIIVAENNPAGTDYSMLPGFPADDSMGITFTRYYDKQRKKDYYGIGGPIYDGANKSRVIGVIAFDIELDKIGSLMNETVETETNEVYLIDETGLLLSVSEYIGKDNKNGILIQEIKSDGAKICSDDLKKYGKNGSVEEHEEEVFRYKNYMGDEVYGAHAYVPIINGCVMAEEHSEEILKFSLTGDIANIFKKEVKNEK